MVLGAWCTGALHLAYAAKVAHVMYFPSSWLRGREKRKKKGGKQRILRKATIHKPYQFWSSAMGVISLIFAGGGAAIVFKSNSQRVFPGSTAVIKDYYFILLLSASRATRTVVLPRTHHCGWFSMRHPKDQSRIPQDSIAWPMHCRLSRLKWPSFRPRFRMQTPDPLRQIVKSRSKRQLLHSWSEQWVEWVCSSLFFLKKNILKVFVVRCGACVNALQLRVPRTRLAANWARHSRTIA